MTRPFWLSVGAIFVVVTLIMINNWSPESHGLATKSSKPQSKPTTIAITQIATHPALDEVRMGIYERLNEAGYYEENTRFVFRNANGDSSLTSAIAQEFSRLNPDVVIPISTPSALAVVREVKVAPIVFSGVTDPVGVGLVNTLEGGNGNITGVSDRWPFGDQVKTFLHYFPNVKTVGMIYTRGDDVSEIGVNALKKLSPLIGFELELRPVSSAADIYPTANALLQDVDAIYTGIDHLVLENIDGLVKAAREAKKPLFGGESGSVEKGAVLAVSINMTDFGRLTGDLVLRILEGEKPSQIAIASMSQGSLLVNREAAIAFGLDLDAFAEANATFVTTK